jgi:hypothetical protein
MCSFISSIFVVDQVDKFTDCFMGLQRVSQFLVKIKFITVSPALFSDTYYASRNQFCQYSLHGTLSDSNLNCYLARRRLWSVCQADKYMDVITEKSPVPQSMVSATHDNASRYQYMSLVS